MGIKMRRFCYKCGASEAKKGPLIQGLCQACFMKENSLIKAPAEVQVKICSRCKAYLVGKQWNKLSNAESGLADAARKAVLSELRFNQFTPVGTKLSRSKEIKGLELRVEPKLSADKTTVDVHARGKVHESQVRPHVEHVEVVVKPKWITCDVCGLISAGHHEAIIQVRGKDMPSEKRRKIKRMLEQCAADAREKDRVAFIAKIEEKAEGLDLYVNPTGLARRMASLLKTKFGAKISESAKLIGMSRNGRQKFKISVLARLPDRSR
jgi:nonsense-mediated mRNA decay protein 3